MSPRATTNIFTPEAIRNLRTSLGLTQAEFGAHLGIGHMQVHKLETGAQPVTRTMALALGTIQITTLLNKMAHCFNQATRDARAAQRWVELFRPPTPAAPRGPRKPK